MSIGEKYFPTAEAYVGLADLEPLEQQPLTERMGAYELELLLANTNTELKCALLGPIGVDPKQPLEMYDQLNRNGAFSIESLSFSYFSKKIKDTSPGLLVTDADGAISLSPFGLVTRAFAGELLEIGKRHGTRIESLLGSRSLQSIDKFSASENPSFRQVSRLFTLLTLGHMDGRRVPLHKVVNKIAGLGEINPQMVDGHLESLASSELIKKDKQRGVRYIMPSKKLRAMQPDLAGLITSTIIRDESMVTIGNMELDTLLQDSSLALLVRRTFLDKKNLPTANQVETMAYEALKTGPMHTSELYEWAVTAGFRGSYDAFANSLKRAIRRFDNPKIRELNATRQGALTYWQRTPSPNGRH